MVLDAGVGPADTTRQERVNHHPILAATPDLSREQIIRVLSYTQREEDVTAGLGAATPDLNR